MSELVCSECGSGIPFGSNPNLCSTPFCTGRMGNSEEYVPSRALAMRNTALEPRTLERTLEPRTLEPPVPVSLIDEAKRDLTAPKPPAPSPHQDVLLALPEDAGARKEIPVCTGVLDYFPAALADVARVSLAGNQQHNPGERLHWSRGKSIDQADSIVRHLMQRGTIDGDGIRHTTKVAWRALALLQEELEAEAGFTPGGE